MYVQDFILKHRLIFEICARGICEKFAYTPSERTFVQSLYE